MNVYGIFPVNKHILIIDDESTIRDSLSSILVDEGFSTLAAASAEEGIELLETESVGLVLLDIWLGNGMDGLTALARIKGQMDIPVIMISGHGTIETAVQAVQLGAYDFIEKPLSYDKVILSVGNGLRCARLEHENRLLHESSTRRITITGSSEASASLRHQIEMIAPTDAWVLIRGEPGTGKKLVAQSIHRLSAGAAQPMVEVSCGAIPKELIESELFGNVNASLAGAKTSARGKFDQADGGTLFINEIADMSLNTQATILRILQEQKFERVGGSQTINVKVRVLAATSKDLELEIEGGRFRADLFYRLNVFHVYVPRLSDRIDDLPELVADFMQALKEQGLKPGGLTEDAFSEMKKHPWPGNVRELRNFVERLAITCPEETVSAAQVRFFLGLPDQTGTPPLENALALFGASDFKEARRLFERRYLQYKLEENGGSIPRTAEAVGLEQSHLHSKLKSLDIIN